jgi:hypothetical protein
MRLSDFWERMRAHFGPASADTFARDFVITDLGNRTVSDALAHGMDAAEVWRVVCRVAEVPPRLR